MMDNNDLKNSDLTDDLNNDNNFAFIENSQWEIKAGGYKIDTSFTGGSAMIGGKKSQSGGGAVSAAFKDLAVPAGLFYLQQNFQKISKPYESAKQINKRSQKSTSRKGKKSEKSYETDFIISENMFDKLLAMVEPQQKKIVDIKTRKRRGTKHKKTRKNRKN